MVKMGFHGKYCMFFQLVWNLLKTHFFVIWATDGKKWIPDTQKGRKDTRFAYGSGLRCSVSYIMLITMALGASAEVPLPEPRHRTPVFKRSIMSCGGRY
jgi:hypothetical protein